MEHYFYRSHIFGVFSPKIQRPPTQWSGKTPGKAAAESEVAVEIVEVVESVVEIAVVVAEIAVIAVTGITVMTAPQAIVVAMAMIVQTAVVARSEEIENEIQKEKPVYPAENFHGELVGKVFLRQIYTLFFDLLQKRHKKAETPCQNLSHGNRLCFTT